MSTAEQDDAPAPRDWVERYLGLLGSEQSRAESAGAGGLTIPPHVLLQVTEVLQ